MKKLIIAILLFTLTLGLTGCKNTNESAASDSGAAKVSASSEGIAADIIKLPAVEKVDASEDVQFWAKDQVEMLIRMLTVDGFYKDEKQTGELIKIKIQDSKITNLQFVKQLDFFDEETIDVYIFDFKLLPENLTDKSLFELDEKGWITSDDNFNFSDAKGIEAKKGQLYLLIHNNNGVLSGIGARRAEPLTEQWCKDLLAYYNYPMGANFKATEEELQRIRDYWKWEEDWSFTMPCYNGYGDTWHVGIGDAYECGLGIPYDYIGANSERAQDMVALTFSTVSRSYYDGLTIISLQGFYGDDPDGIGFAVNQYVSCTQPDCKTSRGIHPGDTVDTLKGAYPEAYENEGYWTEKNEEAGVAEHDNCWIYSPEGTNRSILFLTKNNVIVQIDIADGLDGQMTSPQWLGKYISE